MKSYLYLAILCLAFGFTACEKTSDELTVIELTDEERFDRMQKPLVLFHYASRQLETGQEVGWIVDQQGWVKTYERTLLAGISPASYSEVLATLELQELSDIASPGLFQLGKAELVGHLNQARSISDQHLSPTVTNTEEKVAQGFFAYVNKSVLEHNGGTEGNGECGSGMGMSNSATSYTQLNRLIVDLSGPESRSVTSDKGQKLHQWLIDLNAKIVADQ